MHGEKERGAETVVPRPSLSDLVRLSVLADDSAVGAGVAGSACDLTLFVLAEFTHGVDLSVAHGRNCPPDEC